MTRMPVRMDGRYPAGFHGVVNDAVEVYFAHATIAAAFVTRWCQTRHVENLDGLFRVRDDEPTKRVVTRDHKSPL